MLLKVPSNEAWTHDYCDLLISEIQAQVCEHGVHACFPFIDSFIDCFKQLYKNQWTFYGSALLFFKTSV